MRRIPRNINHNWKSMCPLTSLFLSLSHSLSPSSRVLHTNMKSVQACVRPPHRNGWGGGGGKKKEKMQLRAIKSWNVPRSSDWFDPPCPATLATDWSPIKSRSRKVNEIVIRPDLIIRTVNGDAMRIKFFFFSCDERGGYYFFFFLDARIFISKNFLIIIDHRCVGI